MNNYVVYHLHDDQGQVLDSCTKWNDYVDKAASLGMKAIASTNHGFNLNWTSKKLYAESKGLKFIFGVEAYLTASLYHMRTKEDGTQEKYKVRDNYHTILLAKNSRGMIEINNLINTANDEDHKYYKPRISFEEFLNISDNVIKISACLASPLRKYTKDEIDYNQEFLEKLLQKYDYYEIQAHNCKDQIEYNKYLYEMSKKYGKKLIAATDTHSLNSYKAACRKLLMVSKGIEFSGEDEFDLTFKTYDELCAMFRDQNALPEKVWMDAIEETNVMADSVKSPKLNQMTKYPILTGSTESDAEAYIKKSHEMLEDKIKSGIIPPDEVDRFRADVDDELRVFKKVNMLGFMLSMSDLMCWAKSNNIPVGPGRGSVGGSRCAFVTDIIDVDPVKNNMVFSRFCNENRVEIGDIDVDIEDTDRPKIYKHIFESFGARKCAYVLALGTVSDKGTIDDIMRGLDREWHKENGDDGESPYSLKAADKIKKEYEADPEACKAKYPDVFYYFDGIVDTVVSLSHHPAGVIICPVDVYDRYGVFIDKDGLPVLNLDMNAAHAVGLAKYDILGLDTVGIIDKTCKYAGIPYPHTWEIDFNDEAVWDDMVKSPVGLFQFVKDFAFDSMKKYGVHCIDDICVVTAAIRPGGASYRDKLFQHIVNHNPSKQIDDLLSNSLQYLVFQEQTIAFLQQICGMSGGDADTVRRAIGHKSEQEVAAALPRIMEGYCSHSDKPRAEAEEEAKAFLKIIEDSSSYQFG